MTDNSALPPGTTGTSTAPAAVSGERPDEDLSIAVARTPNIGRLVAAAVVIVAAAAVVWSMAGNPRLRWDVVAQWLPAQTIMKGLLLTLWLTAASMAAGIAIGVVLAIMSGSQNPILSRASAAYVWFFRGTPLLVQLLFWFNLSAVYPRIVIGLPFGGPEFASLSANAIITPAMAAFLGFSLHEAAYMAEIVRAGILSVPRGQTQAATALGMSGLQTMRKIVLPQALKVIIPPTANQTISLLKTTSLVSVLAIPDLLYSAQIIYTRTFQTIPMLIVATILYLITVSLLTIVQSWIERRLSPDADRTARTGARRLFPRRRPS